MANTYRKMYFQIVFAVKGRKSLLDKKWRGQVFEYIAGIINGRGHYSLAVNGYGDHIHIFFDYNGIELLEDLVREIKKASKKYIRENGFLEGKFERQNGYGVFSHGYREKDAVIKYILNQEEHHAKKTFKTEYLQFIKSYDIDFQEKYVFEFLEVKD